jgi:hypothetical protein
MLHPNKGEPTLLSPPFSADLDCVQSLVTYFNMCTLNFVTAITDYSSSTFLNPLNKSVHV